MRYLFIVICAIFLTSCTKNQTYNIDGAVYAGGNFEGEMIYLVPFFNSNGAKIDSAVVQNGRFHFDGTIEGSEVCVLKFRPMMELFLDKLVVIKEPGNVWVILNRPSTAQGTPLNDSLQEWRGYQNKINQELQALNKQLKRATPQEAMTLTQHIDSVKHVFERHNRGVVQRNNNAFGTYVDKLPY